MGGGRARRKYLRSVQSRLKFSANIADCIMNNYFISPNMLSSRVQLIIKKFDFALQEKTLATFSVIVDEGSNVNAFECVSISSFTETHMILADLYI